MGSVSENIDLHVRRLSSLSGSSMERAWRAEVNGSLSGAGALLLITIRIRVLHVSPSPVCLASLLSLYFFFFFA